MIKASLRFFFSTLIALGAVFIAPTHAAEKLNIVASFSILGDLAQQVGGERVQVHTLVGPDADAHMYQPAPSDAQSLAKAKLVVINGWGFEGWIPRLMQASNYRGPIVTASEGVKTLLRPSSQAPDPHAWQDLANAERYVANIARALGDADPANKAFYQANASAYQQKISALNLEVRQMLAVLPATQRKVVTTHDAFFYFGRAYGVSFIAPLGISNDAEPSAGELARIIRQIRREKISAIFLENISDPRLLERIAQESGASIGGTLYSDSLSKPDGPAASYLDMMRHNAKTIAAALARP